jgi:phosphopantothenoylcysteine decarboxylase/phosphopantothenate--cysteine ligase
VTGGIAAYKAAEICSLLKKSGASVRVAMTNSAAEFVGPLTFETLSQHPVYTHLFGEARSYEMEHISWAKWGDVLLIAPASANMIAKMAAGNADDPISTLYLSFDGWVVVAPAMNTQMLFHPATQRNMEILRSQGVSIVEPEEGVLACGDVGRGRLAPVESVVAFLAGQSPTPIPRETDSAGACEPSGGQSELPSVMLLSATRPAEDFTSHEAGDDSLSGCAVLITSGPTHEYLDPVRFLTNPSSGKMGAALAREAARRGATVHFVSGPVGPPSLPSDCATIHRVTTAEQMLRVVKGLEDKIDVFVFAAAVSDFRVANPVGQKIKRTGNSIALPLVENPDIAQAVGCSKRPGQITVGFAAETNDMETNALSKMARKKLDAIVANDVANPRIGFDRDENEVAIYLRSGARRFVSRRKKSEVAREVFDAIIELKAGDDAGPTAGAPRVS